MEALICFSSSTSSCHFIIRCWREFKNSEAESSKPFHIAFTQNMGKWSPSFWSHKTSVHSDVSKYAENKWITPLTRIIYGKDLKSSWKFLQVISCYFRGETEVLLNTSTLLLSCNLKEAGELTCLLRATLMQKFFTN